MACRGLLPTAVTFCRGSAEPCNSSVSEHGATERSGEARPARSRNLGQAAGTDPRLQMFHVEQSIGFKTLKFCF